MSLAPVGWLTTRDAFSHNLIKMSLARGLAGWSHASHISQDKETGLMIRLYAPKKEMRYKHLHKTDRLKA